MHRKAYRSVAGLTLAAALSIGIGARAQTGEPAETAPPQVFSTSGDRMTPSKIMALNLANQALPLIQQAQYGDAMVLLLQALDKDPDCLAALLNAGMCCNQLGRFDEGIDYSSKVVKAAPERFEAWVNLGSSYQGAGRLDEAVQTYQEYLHRFPSEPHRPQVESLVKSLSNEIARQNAVTGGRRHQHQATGSNPTVGTQPAGNPNDASDYFAYSVPDSIMKWTAMPIKVYVPSDAEASAVPGYVPDFGQALRGAFQEWSARSNGMVAYAFLPSPNGADIDCKWVGDPSQVRTPAEGGDANILASVGKGLKHVTITIVTHPNRTANATTAANTVFATALHEVGHSLGITGHSPAPTDIMFSSIPDAVTTRHLTDRDCNTLLHLYRTDVKVGGQFTAAPTGDAKTDLSNQATNLMAAQDFAGAAHKLEAALRIDPNFQVAKINLAVCLTNSANQMGQQGKYNDAISHYKRALDLLREDSDGRRKGVIMKNCATMLYNTNKTSEAQAMEATANRLLGGR